MTTTTLRDGALVATHTVGDTWTDVTTRIPGATGVAGLLRKVSGEGVVHVVKGGSTPPDANSSAGDAILAPGDSVFCEADDIWVRCRSGSAIVVFETL
jgi:hypothetical protein